MTVLDVVKYGDPLLTQPTKLVRVFDESVRSVFGAADAHGHRGAGRERRVVHYDLRPETVSLDKMERVSRDAMIASHEIDHLDGRMLVDRLSDEAYELANHVSCFLGSGGFLFIFLNVVHGGRSFAL